MSDIAARLRGSISDGWSGDATTADADVALEAADRIEALERALQEISEYGTADGRTMYLSASGHLECRRIARAALAEPPA